MKIIKTSKFFIFCMLLSIAVFGQDRILLMNAKVIEAKVIEINDDFIKYKKFSKQDGGDKIISANKVYMVTYENSDYKIIYKKNPSDPSSLEAEDKRMELSGMQDAKQYYKATGNFFWGMGVGFIGGIFGDIRYAPIPPLLFATISEMHAPCLSKQQLSYCFDLCNENYVTGYMRKAGNKKINNSLLGGLIGIGIGFIASKILCDPIGHFIGDKKQGTECN